MSAAELRPALQKLARSIVDYMHDVGALVDATHVARRALMIHAEHAADLSRLDRVQLVAELELYVRDLVGKELDA